MGLETLDIKIQGNATRANNVIDKLVGYLDKLEISLSKLDGSSLISFANGVDTLSNSLSRLNSSGIKTQDFTRLKKNLDTLANINFGGLVGNSKGIEDMANALSKLNSVSGTSSNIAELVNGLGRLGGVQVQRAIVNIPALTNQLSQMMTALSRVPRVSNNIIQMTNAMANLASNGNRVGTATRSLGSGLNAYNRSATEATKKTFSLAAAFGKFYASYFLVVRGIKGLFKSVKDSMDYVETFNYFNVTMDKVGNEYKDKYADFGYESAEAYADSFKTRISELTTKMTGYAVGQAGELNWANISNLGLDPEQLMNFQARIGAITNSVGLVGEASVSTSKALSMLSADLSSLTNTDLDTVMTNLTSGLIGQSRALYKYGIDITNASLATYALENNINKSVSEMTQSEKMQLRLLVILDRSKNAWADQVATINSVANQYRVFGQQVGNLGRVLGNLLLPIIQRVLPMVNGLVIALSNLFTQLGFRLWGKTWLTDIMDGISGGAAATDDLVDGLEDVEDSFNGTTKAANKMKKSILAFDELNVLSKDKDKSGAGASMPEIDLSPQLQDALDKYEKVWNRAFSGLENNAFEFATKISNALKPVSSIFKDLFNGDYYSAGAKTGKLAEAFFDWISRSLKSVDWYTLGKKVGKFFAGINWKGIMKSVAKAAWTALWSALKLMAGAFSTAPIETAIMAIFGANKIWKWAVNGKLVKSISSLLTKFMALGDTAIIAGQALLGNQNAASALTLLYPKLSSVVEGVKNGFVNFFNSVKGGTFFTDMNNGITALRDKMSPFQKALVGVTSVLVEFFATKDGFKKLALGADDVVGAIAEIGVSAGIAAAALYTAFGPVGIAIAGVTALVGALVGIGEALDQKAIEAYGQNIHDALVNPGGVGIDELAKGISSSFDEASKGFDLIVQSSSEMDVVQSNIHATWIEIYKIQEAMDAGVVSVEEGKKKLDGLFNELASLTESKFSAMNTAILSAYGPNGSLLKGLQQMGVDTEAAIDAMITYGSNNSERAKEIAKELSGMDVNSEEYKQLITELASLTGEMDAFAKSTSDFTYNMKALEGKIDYSKILNPDTGEIDTSVLNSYLDDIEGSLSAYQEQLNTAGAELASYWTMIYESAGATDEQKAAAKESLDALPNLINQMVNDAALQAAEFTDVIQTDLFSKMSTIIDNSISDFENRGFGEKLMASLTGKNDQGKYVSEAVSAYKESIGEVSDAIEERFSTLGVEGAGWAKDASNAIFDSLFPEQSTYVGGNKHITKTINEDYKNIITKATEGLSDLAESRGKDAVNGYANAFSDHSNVYNSGKEVKGFIENMMDVIAEAQDSHSPSKVTNALGKDAVDGYVNAFPENTDSSKIVIGKFVEDITSSLAPISDNFRAIAQNTIYAFKDGIDLTKYLVDNQFTSDKWTFDGVRNGLVASFQSAIESIKYIWNNFVDVLNQKLTLKIDNLEIDGKKIMSETSISLGSVPKFFNGGFAEDGLFMANHGELVGRFANGKTAIANNGQIIEGIKSGVIDAMMQVHMATSGSGGNSNRPIEIPLIMNGREVGRATADSLEDLIRDGVISPSWI